jgi:hypothetical protein
MTKPFLMGMNKCTPALTTNQSPLKTKNVWMMWGGLRMVDQVEWRSKGQHQHVTEMTKLCK